MTYADAVTDLDVRRVIDFHLSHGKLATVTAVRPIGRFGSIKLDGHLVSKFVRETVGRWRVDQWGVFCPVT